MTGYVFDAEAIIAFLYDEPGHQAVARLLNEVEADDADGYLAEANASEIYYLVARFSSPTDTPTADSLRTADRDLRTLQRAGLTIKRSDWRLTGEIKAHGHISLADAAAVALAHEHDATLIIGADDDFETLPVDVTRHQFRTSN